MDVAVSCPVPRGRRRNETPSSCVKLCLSHSATAGRSDGTATAGDCAFVLVYWTHLAAARQGNQLVTLRHAKASMLDDDVQSSGTTYQPASRDCHSTFIRQRPISVIIASANEVMFSHVSVCLSACLFCLSAGLLIRFLRKLYQIFMKFYGMVGHNPKTNRLDFE